MAVTGTRREHSDDEIVLRVLDAVERDENVTQRHLAGELGIALGLANTYLKRCVRKGLIKMSQVPRRRFAYYLTPQGFSEKSRLTAQYLTDSFAFFRRARTQCSEIFAKAASQGHRRIALIGAGDLAEIATLVARESPAEIAGVVAWSGDDEQLARELAALGPVDAVLVTSLEDARNAHAAAIARYESDRVYAPDLLRLPKAAKPGGGEEAA